MGRICGCLLGKTVEGIRTDELIPFLKETGNYPMHRYILQKDLNEKILNKYKFSFASKCYADTVDGMPVDDDTNYTVLYQEIIQKYGKDFTPFNVSRAWLSYQPKYAYYTAEKVAFCNFIKGYSRRSLPFIKTRTVNGSVHKSEPTILDISIPSSPPKWHGGMFVAAMLAVAAETNNIKDIILGGLAHIPHTSRLYEEIMAVVNGFENGVSQGDCFKSTHEKYDEYSSHGWCHTISNAMIVTASLLYGCGDYGKSICMAVETGFDTDCNGATVGSVLGMASGIESVPEYWTKPINDTLHTSIFGIGTVKISDRIKQTMNHINL